MPLISVADILVTAKMKVGFVFMLVATCSNAFQFDNQGSVPSNNQSYSNATHSNQMLNYTAAEADGSVPLARCCDPGCFVNYSDTGEFNVSRRTGLKLCYPFLVDGPFYESSPPSRFDKYWCGPVVSSSGCNEFQVNNAGPLSSGLNPSARNRCYSLEAADFTSFLATNDPSSTQWAPIHHHDAMACLAT